MVLVHEPGLCGAPIDGAQTPGDEEVQSSSTGKRGGHSHPECHLLTGPQRQRQGHAVPQAAPPGNWLLWAPQAGVGTKLHKRAGMVSAKVTALLPGKIGDIQLNLNLICAMNNLLVYVCCAEPNYTF